eukprot:24833-Ditylum_brightwellii.AAC.1
MDHASPQTIPVTDGALLAEESTINPLSPLPSFLELALVESTASSGRAALLSSFEAIASSLSATISTSSSSARNGSFLQLCELKCYHLLDGILQKYGPEIRAIILYFIERSFLHSTAVRATASESIYGLRRARAVVVNNNINQSVESSSGGGGKSMSILPMSKEDGTRSAMLAALAPYVKEKLDLMYKRENRRLATSSGENGDRIQQQRPSQTNCNRHENHGSQSNSITNQSSLYKRLQRLFIATYPFLHMTHEGTVLAYRFAYLIGKSVYYGPSLHALGLVLRRVTQADFSKQQLPQSVFSTEDQSLSSSSPRNTSTKSKTTSATMMEQSLPKIRKVAISIAATALLVGWIASYREEIRRRRRRWIVGSDTNDIRSADDTSNNYGPNATTSPKM